MTTAIIGVGNIGGRLARDLVRGGVPVMLAAKDESHADGLARELGELASAGSVEEAIAAADVAVFAVWLDTSKELIAKHGEILVGKVVVDPSNPIGFDENGQVIRTLPDDQSAGSVVAALLPTGAHYVKAFGTLEVPPYPGGGVATKGRVVRSRRAPCSRVKPPSLAQPCGLRVSLAGG
jgi:8-hydroxy-5-deazaflavin:NADPH oxidoreductase